MNDDPNPKLDKLLALAKQAPELSAEEPLKAPPGLTTKVAARWASEPSRNSMSDLLERWGIWSLGGAVAVCLTLVFVTDTQETMTADSGAFEALLFGPETEDDTFGLF